MSDPAADTEFWLPRAMRAYTRGVGVMTIVGAGLVLALGPVGTTVATASMAVAVALIGLPHGAYDLEVARTTIRPLLGRAWLPFFIAAYLLLVIAAAAFWWLAPWVGLALLLAVGAVHWGADDLRVTPRRPALRWWLVSSRGAIPVALPLLFHPDATAGIFGALTGGAEIASGDVFVAGAVAAGAAVPGVIFGMLLERRPDLRRLDHSIFEVLALVLWFWAVEPLLAFTLYFCFWHAIRHSLRSISAIEPGSPRVAARMYLRSVAVPTIATWGLGAGAWILFFRGASEAADIWRIVFIGLFALTVPHVLLEALSSRLHAAASRRKGSRPMAPEAVAG